MKENKNTLEFESSPYLRQHALNPVHWKPWGQQAFDGACENQKPIFLSIGYSTCHWCHVMEEESFEDQEVADLLNSEFVSIKVDREERPDVDDVYMTAVQQLMGHGGWPLSVFLFPDGKPFFGGTYFPKKNFIELLQKIKAAWTTHHMDLKKNSEILSESLMKEWSETQKMTNATPTEVQKALRQFEKSMEARFDPEYGGFSGAPKFPQSMNIRALLRARENSNQLAPLIEKTLFEMSHRGLMDHVGGGFHRYSTDEQWLVPHFEKMLYDNALLSLTYLEAYQHDRNPIWAEVVHKTLVYLQEKLKDPKGAFYSAEDADSLDAEGKKSEGYFYSWTATELNQAPLHEVFKISEEGNFEGRTLLEYQEGKSILDAQKEPLSSILLELKKQRELRAPPHLDTKIITSWNAIMIAAFAKASLVLEEPQYLEQAIQAFQYLEKNHFLANGSLVHSSCDGKTQSIGFSEDYAALSFALIHLYEATADEKYIDQAQVLYLKQEEKFSDSQAEGYFRNEEGDALLPFRPKETYEGVFPTVQTLTAWNLVRFATYFQKNAYLEKAKKIIHHFLLQDANAPQRYPFLCSIAYEIEKGVKELIQVTQERSSFKGELQKSGFFQKFQPQLILGYANAEAHSLPCVQGKKLMPGSEVTYYLCENGQCLAPFKHLNEVPV